MQCCTSKEIRIILSVRLANAEPLPSAFALHKEEGQQSDKRGDGPPLAAVLHQLKAATGSRIPPTALAMAMGVFVGCPCTLLVSMFPFQPTTKATVCIACTWIRSICKS